MKLTCTDTDARTDGKRAVRYIEDFVDKSFEGRLDPIGVGLSGFKKQSCGADLIRRRSRKMIPTLIRRRRLVLARFRRPFMERFPAFLAAPGSTQDRQSDSDPFMPG